MPRVKISPRVRINTTITESKYDYLMKEAKKRDISLAKLVQLALDELIITVKEAERGN